MPKTLREASLTTRNARERLEPGVHYRSIDATTHLGYRKSTRHGVWLVRWRNGVGYKQVTIGTADDALSVGTFSYEAALKAARETVERERAEAKATADGEVLTVRLAVQKYVAERDAIYSERAGRTVRSDANRRLGRYITGAAARGNQPEIAPKQLAGIALHQLTKADLRDWIQTLPKSLKQVSLDRTVGDLKAALNSAYQTNDEKLDPSLPDIIKSGLKLKPRDDERESIARENQILTIDEVRRLLKAVREVDAEDGWQGDLYRLLLVMAETGARFSQVIRMRVADCQHAQGRLVVPVSRKGTDGKTGSTTFPVDASILRQLAVVTEGRDPNAPLLERWRYARAAAGTEGKKAERGAWTSSSNIMKSWYKSRDRAGLPNAIPYSLRHSSIVRLILANIPIRLVAARHDTSIRMIERHYSRWIVDGSDEMLRGAVVPLSG